jgi:rod shape-determining protein MreC
MAVYQRRRSRTRYVLAVLVLVAITLITIDARSGNRALSGIRNAASDVFTPLQEATHDVLRPIGNFLAGAVDYGSLRAENQRLRQELASLEAKGIQAQAAEAAAAQLLAEQHLPFVGSIPTVSVQVIDQGSSNFEDQVTIDKGTSSGVAVGQPVVAAGGLVGSVAQASANDAVVVLLTDPTFAVGVRLDANNVGTAQGEGLGQPMRVTVVTTSAPPPSLKKGQALSTSGLSMEKFPPGIPVGRVSRVSSSPGSIEPSVSLKPIVNLSQLDYLQVLLWSPQT